MSVNGVNAETSLDGSAQGAAMRGLEILIVDDHVLFRQGLTMVLENIYPNTVIHEASNIDKATEIAAAQDKLDLVLLDLVLPETNGFDGLETLARLLPETPIIVISSVENSSDINSALSFGASGYIVKSSSSTVLRHALSLVLSGEIYLPSHLARNIGSLPSESRMKSYTTTNIVNTAPSLTPRQLEVLALIARGQTNKEIARNIGTEEGTVKVHVKAIMEKLGANNRTHAVINGARFGIIPQSMTGLSVSGTAEST